MATKSFAHTNTSGSWSVRRTVSSSVLASEKTVPAGKLGGTRIKPVCAECVHKALVSLEEGTAVFRIPGKCKTPAPVLDQCIRKVKDAQMIFHEQKIRVDLCHVSIGGRIEKEERDTESAQHLDIFRVGTAPGR